MIKRLFVPVVLSAAACSHRSETAASDLPAKFTLNCGAPTGPEIPEEAKNGFKILVDRTARNFSLSWEPAGPWPITGIAPDEIILVDAHVEHGLDGNPEDRRIAFDRRTGT